ncbi:hypothetical protein Tco_0660568 [Tanacetum coccineum]
MAALELMKRFGNGTLVWHYVRSMADMDLLPPTLHQIVTHLAPMAKHRTARSVIGRLLLAASAYFIWIERNNRLFKNSRKTLEEIRDCIMVTVHLKLLTFRFKNKAMVSSLLAKWNMPSNFWIYANLFEDIQCAGFDTRPPMLDRTDFESWQQRIRLYCLGKDNGVNILQSIDEGSFKMGKFRETLAEGALRLGSERDKVFANLTPEEKERFKADIRSELTKDERESQLYDEFKHFRQNKGETIYEYYVRFTKLINDMRNIKMTMPKMQHNSKFVNNMLPEWGRFVTAVKHNRGLKTSNYNQLYVYLKQHEVHANKNKMMLERYTQHSIDPLALVSNVSPHQYPSQSSANPQSAYVPPVNYQPQFADNIQPDSELHLTQGTKLQFKTAGLLLGMFRVDRTEVRGIMLGEQLQLEMGEFRTELAMQILVKQSRLSVITAME